MTNRLLSGAETISYKDMDPAIDQIISSDEAARAVVDRARKDAAKLIADAEARAQRMLADLEVHIVETERGEIAPILEDGQKQAQVIMENAHQYVEKLRHISASVKGRIVADYLQHVVKT